MILRKLLLNEPKLAIEFPNKLTLWFDRFSDNTLETLDTFFKGNYQLKKVDRSKEYTQRGISVIEYADNSLYNLHGEGNLLEYYLKEKANERKMISSNIRIREPNQIYERDPSKYAEQVKRYFIDNNRIENMKSSLEKLETHLNKGSSALVTITKNLEDAYYASTMEEPPRDYEKFEPNIVKINLLPVRKEVLTELVGLLFGVGMYFETEKHKELLQGIINGKITEYNGHAYEEYHREIKEKIGNESAKLVVV